MILSSDLKPFALRIVLNAILLMNRIPTKIFKNKSSYEILYRRMLGLGQI